MRALRDVATALAILAGTVGGVAAATIGLSALMIPASATAVATPTPVPSFDLAVAPTAIGGSLTVTGDRAGTLLLDEASGVGGRFEDAEDGGFILFPEQDAELRGADGRIRLERDTGAVVQIDYDGLSFYLDPGECSMTLGEVNAESGLMAALVECPDIVDIRDNGTISIAGVIALPAAALRGRGDLPPNGGTVAIGNATVTIDDAEMFWDETTLEENDVIQWGFFTNDFRSGIQLEYDVEADRYALIGVSLLDLGTELPEPCPLGVEELGPLDEVTTVLRMTIDCADVPLPDGTTGLVSGEIVVDVISAVVEAQPGP